MVLQDKISHTPSPASSIGHQLQCTVCVGWRVWIVYSHASALKAASTFIIIFITMRENENYCWVLWITPYSPRSSPPVVVFFMSDGSKDHLYVSKNSNGWVLSEWIGKTETAHTKEYDIKIKKNKTYSSSIYTQEKENHGMRRRPVPWRRHSILSHSRQTTPFTAVHIKWYGLHLR